MSETDSNRLQRVLNATPDCLPLERMSEGFTSGEREHIATCARCQTELELWRELEDPEAGGDDGAAVQWIVAELGRRAKPQSPARWRIVPWLPPGAMRWAAAFATVAVVASVGYLAWDREPSLTPLTTDQVYRGGRLEIVAPIGDVPRAPAALEWVAPDGAVSYDVEVSEVDGTPLWRATSSTPHIDIAESLVRQLTPGKTVAWQVRARDASNNVIAESGQQRFRIEIPRAPRG